MNKSLNISLRIVALFVVAMLASFIPDYLHNFCGDTLCGGNLKIDFCSLGADARYSKHGPEWHWAYRHYLFIFMGLSLAIAQLISIVNYATED